MIFRFPFTPAQPQRFSIPLAGVTYEIVVRWNDPAACWILDIYSQTGVLILGGVALVTGCNLLEQYEYLGLGGGLEVQTDNDTFAVPTFANLGSTGNLYFIVPE